MAIDKAYIMGQSFDLKLILWSLLAGVLVTLFVFFIFSRQKGIEKNKKKTKSLPRAVLILITALSVLGLAYIYFVTPKGRDVTLGFPETGIAPTSEVLLSSIKSLYGTPIDALITLALVVFIIFFAISAFRNVSIGRRELETLALAKAKEEAILFSVGDGLLVTDEEGNITLINRTAEKLLGKKSALVVGRKFYDIYNIRDEKNNFMNMKDLPLSVSLATGKKVTSSSLNTYWYVQNDKTEFPAAFTVTPIMLHDKVIGAIDIFRDITEEKEIDRAKSEFVSLASHQLKTPASAISWLTERLLGGRMGKLTLRQKEYFTDIRTTNQRMIELVNALLNVSRIELGTFVIKPEKSDIYKLVKDLIHELDPIASAKQIKFRESYPEKSVEILVDEQLFRMIITNIVTNAVNYSPEGGEVGIRCREVKKGESLGGRKIEENSVLIEVDDAGFGIPSSEQSKIFTKFFRADNARQKHPDGTGLGLYIVKSILENSGGAIWFESDVDKGSKFYIAIPLSGMKQRSGMKSLLVPQNVR